MAPSNATRRRVLAIAGAGVAASLAGCAGIGDGSNETGADGDGQQQVTVLVSPNRQALLQARTNITRQVQAGELNRTQVQRELHRVRQTAVASAVEALRNDIVGTQVTIEASLADQGALLVSGPEAALIDLLSKDRVSALLPAQAFQQVQARAGQTPTGVVPNTTAQNATTETARPGNETTQNRTS